MTTRRALTFGDGIATAFGLLATMALVYFAAAVDTWRQMYRDFGSDALPTLTHLVLSPAWQVAAPLAGVAALAYTLVRRPSLRVAIAATVVSILLVVLWIIGLYQPIWSLAGNISG
jgi:hypothetical protein